MRIFMRYFVLITVASWFVITNSMVNTAKVFWQGLVPSWAPVSILGLGVGAGFVTEYLLFEKMKGSAYYGLLKNKAGLSVAAFGAYLAYTLRQKTPTYIVSSAQELTNQLKHDLLFTSHIIDDSSLAQAFSSKGVLASKYPLVAASVRLENVLAKIILMIERCNVVLQYSEPHNNNFLSEVSSVIEVLRDYNKVVSHNLTYIKVTRSNDYLAQIKNARDDRSIEAQELIASAQNSQKNLMWIKAVVKFISAVIKLPFNVIYYVVNPGKILPSIVSTISSYAAVP